MQTTTMLRNGEDPHPVSVSQTASTRPQTGAICPLARHTPCTLQNGKGHHTVDEITDWAKCPQAQPAPRRLRCYRMAKIITPWQSNGVDEITDWNKCPQAQHTPRRVRCYRMARILTPWQSVSQTRRGRPTTDHGLATAERPRVTAAARQTRRGSDAGTLLRRERHETATVWRRSSSCRRCAAAARCAWWGWRRSGGRSAPAPATASP